MAARDKDKMLVTVRQMFALVKRTPDSNKLDEEGMPVRLRDMAEAIFSDDVQFHVPGKGPQAFDGGKAAYYQYNIKRMAATAGNQRLELIDILVGEDHAAGVIRYSDERDGKTFSWLRTNVYRFDETGDRIVDVTVFEHDQHGVDAWFSTSLS